MALAEGSSEKQSLMKGHTERRHEKLKTERPHNPPTLISSVVTQRNQQSPKRLKKIGTTMQIEGRG